MWNRSSLLGLLLALAPLLGLGQMPIQVDSIRCPGGSSLALIFLPPGNEQAEAARLATHDIAAGHLFLLLQSGIAPRIYSADQAFSKKYGIDYWEEGCTGPDFGNMRAYNEQMFDYLTTRYGRSWLREVRKDVIGLREWRKTH